MTTKILVPYYKPLFMKPTLLLGCALLAGTAVHAQFSLLPYAGFEQSRNNVGYGNALSAADINGNLKAGLKMDYRFKSGHSPFVNLTTTPAPVSFAFSNTGSLLNTTRQGGLLLRLEGGYQYSSGPISFGKKHTGTRTATALTETNTQQRKSCGAMAYRSHCGERKSSMKTAPANETLNMRLQPSLALAYVPAAVQNVEQTAGGFTYASGSWKTAIVPALGFEFAKGAKRLFTLSAFYTRPLGRPDQKVTTLTEGKPYITNLAPQASTWGLTLGVPFGLSKTKSAKQPAMFRQPATEKRHCTRNYTGRCMQWQ